MRVTPLCKRYIEPEFDDAATEKAVRAFEAAALSCRGSRTPAQWRRMMVAVRWMNFVSSFAEMNRVQKLRTGYAAKAIRQHGLHMKLALRMRWQLWFLGLYRLNKNWEEIPYPPPRERTRPRCAAAKSSG